MMYVAIIVLLIAMICAVWYLKSEKLGLVLVVLSVVAGQLIRLSLGTDDRGGSAIIMSDVTIVGLAVTWFVKKLTKDPKVEPNKLSGPLLAFILIALASLFQGYVIIARTGVLELKEMIVALLYWIRFVEYALVFFIAFDVMRTVKEMKYMLKWILITGVLVAIGGFIQLIVMPDFTAYAVQYGWDPHYNRLLSTFFDPNFVGGYFGMLMSIAVAMLFYESRLSTRILLILGILTMGVALILTISRSGLLAFVVGLGIIGIIRSRIILLVGIMCIVLALVASPRFFTRITEGLSVDETGVKRIESWEKGIKLTAGYPILGVGYNNLASVQDDLGLVDMFDVNNRSGFENSLLTILVTTGFIGFFSYLYILWVFLKSAYDLYISSKSPPYYKGLSLGIFAGILGIIANSMFINSLLYPFILINIWIFAAMIMRMRNDVATISIHSDSITT